METQKPKIDKNMQLAIRADEEQRAGLKKFKYTELADLAITPQNIVKIENIVEVCNQQRAAFIEGSAIKMGMYFCWLKVAQSQHGDFEKLCAKRFPNIPARSRQRWMLAYQVAIGEKPAKAKELPAPEDFEDAEYVDLIESFQADRKSLASRSTLDERVRKLEATIEKGMENSRKKDERIELLEKELERTRAEAFIPPHVKDEDLKCVHIKNAFWHFVTIWNANLPADEERLKPHFALCRELEQEMVTLWEEHLGPAFEIKREKKNKA